MEVLANSHVLMIRSDDEAIDFDVLLYIIFFIEEINHLHLSTNYV